MEFKEAREGSGPLSSSSQKQKRFLELWRGELGSPASLPFQPHSRLSSFSLSDSISALCPANSEAGGRVHSLYRSALIRSS